MMLLLENIIDKRGKTPAKTIIVVPVGDTNQLKDFVAHVKKAKIDQGRDFLFVYLKGLNIVDAGLHAVHAFEAYPLGTSGAFFACQYYAYLLDYPYIVVADADALLDSNEDLVKMTDQAEKSGKATAPIAVDPSWNAVRPGNWNPNCWTVFPRGVFEKAGFSVPFFWKNGDDSEMTERLLGCGQVELCRDATARHPVFGPHSGGANRQMQVFSSMTIFHVLLNKKKYCPYLAGSLKYFLLTSTQMKKRALLYFFWYVYYNFIADAFQDGDLKRAVTHACSWSTIVGISQEMESPYFGIEKISENYLPAEKPFADKLRIAESIASLLIFKKYDALNERLSMKIPRLKFAAMLLRGAVLLPFNVISAFRSFSKWSAIRGKITYPVFPKNAEVACEQYASLLARGELS